MGATLYLAGFEGGERIPNPKPCQMCERLIENAGIINVVTNEGQDGPERGM